jgi:hypothetical protein
MDKNIKYFPLNIKKEKLNAKGTLKVEVYWIATEKVKILPCIIDIKQRFIGNAGVNLHCFRAGQQMYMSSQLHAVSTLPISLPTV